MYRQYLINMLRRCRCQFRTEQQIVEMVDKLSPEEQHGLYRTLKVMQDTAKREGQQDTRRRVMQGRRF